MRFVAQDLSSGVTSLVDGPAPVPPRHGIVVRTVASAVSAGTERMLVDFGRANLVQKARQQPERVREVIDKARTDGVTPTLEAVRHKLAQAIPLGYANAGIVVEVGAAVNRVAVGQMVATNGGHAEVVAVPLTMAAVVPEGIPAEQACFASVASVGLEAIRLTMPTIGERFVVSGLGLIGLLTVQLLRAQGCAVLGIDPDPRRRQLAEYLGARASQIGEASEAAAAEFSRGRGVDGVIVCASSPSSEPVRSAARMCRTRGRVVLVGVTGLHLDRTEFYDREISFQVSRSYGPGRQEARYEAGYDYPFGHVRWTAGRNMEAVLDLMASGALDAAPLITHRLPFDDAVEAYDTLVSGSALGILLQYPGPEAAPTAGLLRRVTMRNAVTKASRHTVSANGAAGGHLANGYSRPGIAVVGAGSFTTRVLLPAIKAAGGRLDVIAAPSGVSAALVANKEQVRAASDVDAVLDDPTIGSVFIATRHDAHAELTERALRAGKNVYVEKPLGLTIAEIALVASSIDEVTANAGAAPVLAVGFNRRFAPLTTRMRALLDQVSAPKAVVITVNAGQVPRDHWTRDPEIGGGRLLGEGCHFIDLARHLVGHPIIDVRTRFLGDSPSPDTASVSLAFEDGSTADIHYLANGAPNFPKERVEVFTQGRILVNDNFRALKCFGWPGQRNVRLRKQDKGHRAAVAAFLRAASGLGQIPVPADELIEVSEAAIYAATPNGSMSAERR
jgi:predicted dehydrogenase/threonine dehydrogenase-like Zn-dependent dehydrogenase